MHVPESTRPAAGPDTESGHTTRTDATEVPAPADRATAPNQLRPHQVEAVGAVRIDQVRQQLVMACGTGKTLTGQHAVAKLLDDETGTVLVLVPTLTLLQQTFESWAEHAPFAFDAIAVCSKLTAAERRDAGTEETIDVDQLTLPATTDPAALAAFLAGDPGRVRVVFGTYQSLGAVIVAHTDHATAPWSIVLCDEAHRTAGRKTKPFARVLHDEHVPAGKRMFLTATPKVHTVSEKESASEKASLLASMDDEDLYGPRVYALSVAEAIEKKILSEYQVAVIGVEDAELHAAAQVLDRVTVNGQQFALDHVAAIVALSKAAQEHGLHSIIAFFNSIRASKAFVAAFTAVHEARTGEQVVAGLAEHIDGSMKLGVRREALDRLAKPREDGYHLVSNARCLSEGIDVPTLDAVLFGEPRTSQIEVVQCVGRAIRKNGDRTALIILAVRVGDGDDIEAAIEEQQFKKIRQVLAALEDHDPRIAEAARILARASTTSGGELGWPGDEKIRWAKGLLAIDVPERVLGNGFELRLLDSPSRKWEVGIRELRVFTVEHGHARVPQYHISSSGFRLGLWVSHRRRQEFRNCKENVEKVNELELFPGWVWDTRDLKWENGLAELREFARENGHCQVPVEFITASGYKLGRWVHTKRSESVRGVLLAERAAQLEALPGWTWSTGSSRWSSAMAELRIFAFENGHTRVPDALITPSGLNLGAWVSSRRKDKRKGILSKNRVMQLESFPGWTWSMIDDRWDEGLSQLQLFLETHGHVRVPQRYLTESGFKLGSWVSNRRMTFRDGNLSTDRVIQLETFPGWTWDASRKTKNSIP